MPSNTALATSLTSARVGAGAAIIDSSICVAVTTGVPSSTQWRMIRFCRCGTSSSGQSMPEIAAGDHHGVGGGGDAGEVAERRSRLDLGHDLRSVADDATELLDVARLADERQGDVVGAGRGHRLGELEILGGRSVQGEPLARQVDAGPTLRASTGLDLGDERIGGLVDDPQRDLPVAEHDTFADVDLREQVGIVDGDLLGGALAIAGDEPNVGRGHEVDTTVGERPGADLRARAGRPSPRHGGRRRR